jgi:hypothetical protein
MPSFQLTNWKRQRVAARFVSNPEVAAGFAPFRSVRLDSAAANTELRK